MTCTINVKWFFLSLMSVIFCCISYLPWTGDVLCVSDSRNEQSTRIIIRKEIFIEINCFINEGFKQNEHYLIPVNLQKPLQIFFCLQYEKHLLIFNFVLFSCHNPFDFYAVFFKNINHFMTSSINAPLSIKSVFEHRLTFKCEMKRFFLKILLHNKQRIN